MAEAQTESADPLYFEHLPMQQFVPAAGQGILAVEIRQGELTEIMRSRERIVYARWQGEKQREESKAIDWTSRPRQELFESFYKQTRGRAPSRDTTALFLEMISDEGSEADETAEADV